MAWFLDSVWVHFFFLNPWLRFAHVNLVLVILCKVILKAIVRLGLFLLSQIFIIIIIQLLN